MDTKQKIKELKIIATDEIITLADISFRFGAKTKFDSLIEKKYQDLYNGTLLDRKKYENAFLHAYSSAYLVYYLDEKTALNLGYGREVSTQNIEKHKFGSKENAFLDTNRDLWNNQIGIEYAKRLKAQGKSLDEVAEEIFKNLMQKDSDFIVDYEKDKRRWDNSTKDNIWKKIEEKMPEAEYKKFEILGNILNSKPVQFFLDLQSRILEKANTGYSPSKEHLDLFFNNQKNTSSIKDKIQFAPNKDKTNPNQKSKTKVFNINDLTFIVEEQYEFTDQEKEKYTKQAIKETGSTPSTIRVFNIHEFNINSDEEFNKFPKALSQLTQQLAN